MWPATPCSVFASNAGLKQAASLWQFVGGNQMQLHRSVLLGYRYYLLRGMLIEKGQLPPA